MRHNNRPRRATINAGYFAFNKRAIGVLVVGLSAAAITGCTTGGSLESVDQIPAGTETVRMSVGETRRVDAYRGRTCSSPAPSWESIQRILPRSSLVTYSDGGLATRNSRSCGKVVPTRAVNGTAIARGVELNQYSDPVAIIVD